MKTGIGQAEASIRASAGQVASDPMNFYATSYTMNYCKASAVKENNVSKAPSAFSASASLRKTSSPPPLARVSGYSSNLRPYVPYTKVMDSVVNPGFLKELETASTPIFRSDYKDTANNWHRGDKRLPGDVHMAGSGFTRNLVTTNTLLGKGKGYIKNSTTKRVVDFNLLNDHSSRQCTTAGESYVRQCLAPSVATSPRGDGNYTQLGPKRLSGFTQATQPNPIIELYALNSAQTPRETTSTLHFPRPPVVTGGEELPQILTSPTQTANGYTHSSKRRPFADGPCQTSLQVPPNVTERVRRADPAEHVNMTHSHPHTSLTTTSYQAPETQLAPFEPTKVKEVGEKEISGYVDNEDTYVPKVDRKRYNSEYSKVFENPGPKFRRGCGGVSNIVVIPDGYSRRGFKKPKSVPPKSKELLQMHPSVARHVQLQGLHFDRKRNVLVVG